MRIVMMIGVVIGALCLLVALFAGGAPQQAAWAATACAFAVIPYVGYRASQLDEDARDRRRFYDDALAKLDSLNAKQ
jgi:hypothetical protein